MVAKSSRFYLIVLLAFCCTASPLEPKSRKINWLSGTVVDVAIQAKGAAAVRDTGTRSRKGESRPRRKDLWWEYSVRSGSQIYVGVLRRSPGRSGLRIDTPVRFFVSRGRLYLLNPKGQRLELRILRKEDAEADPPQASTFPAGKNPPR